MFWMWSPFHTWRTVHLTANSPGTSARSSTAYCLLPTSNLSFCFSTGLFSVCTICGSGNIAYGACVARPIKSVFPVLSSSSLIIVSFPLIIQNYTVFGASAFWAAQWSNALRQMESWMASRGSCIVWRWATVAHCELTNHNRPSIFSARI